MYGLFKIIPKNLRCGRTHPRSISDRTTVHEIKKKKKKEEDSPSGGYAFQKIYYVIPYVWERQIGVPRRLAPQEPGAAGTPHWGLGLF